MKKFFLLVLVLAGALVLAGCQSQPEPAESPKAEAQTHKQADTNLLELARQLEKTLHQAVDIHAAGGDTNRLLKELEKFRE